MSMSKGPTQGDYKQLSEAMTILRWMYAVFTSFIPEGSKERRPFEKKIQNCARLRDLCENAAIKVQESQVRAVVDTSTLHEDPRIVSSCSWEYAATLEKNPRISEALHNFYGDATEDNGTALIQTIINVHKGFTV